MLAPRQIVGRAHVVFDLDGTLVDSFGGISASLAQALGAHGFSSPALERELVGKPLGEIIQTTAPGAGHHIWELIENDFRRYYDSIGFTLTLPFDGIHALLRQLDAKGTSVYVCTMKPRAVSVRIIDSLGWSRYMRDVFGRDSCEGDRVDKSVLLRQLLRRHKMARSDAVYIGDYATDVVAAKANGVPSIAVTYGYGNKDDLVAMAPDCLCASVADLTKVLLRDGRGEPCE